MGLHFTLLPFSLAWAPQLIRLHFWAWHLRSVPSVCSSIFGGYLYHCSYNYCLHVPMVLVRQVGLCRVSHYSCFIRVYFWRGLSLAMLNHQVVRFFDIFGLWIRLAFVMAGGTSECSWLFPFRQKGSVGASQFHLPRSTNIDMPLIVGSALLELGGAWQAYVQGLLCLACFLIRPRCSFSHHVCGLKAWVCAESKVVIKAQLKRTFTQPLPLFPFWLFGMCFLFAPNEPECAKPVCKVDAKICAWTDKIVGVKTPNMVASGFQISPDLIVTNRHVAEDHLRVLVRNAEGKVQPAVPYRMIFQ